MAIFVKIFENYISGEFVKIWEFTLVIILVIFHKNGNLCLEMKFWDFLEYGLVFTVWFTEYATCSNLKTALKFTFNEITGQMIKKGVNPFVFTNTDDRFYDKYRSHFNGYGKDSAQILFIR